MSYQINKNYSYFPDRASRAEFIVQNFSDILKNCQKILDVGCDENYLQKKLGSKVTGIDIAGSPDHKVDLEKFGLSKFSRRSYDLLVCTEVLEHLDIFYELLSDLFRVSNRYVIISLPNSTNLFNRLHLLFYGKLGKYYGLPISRPIDRHKWLFGWKEADRLITLTAKKSGFVVNRKFLNYNFSSSLLGRFAVLISRFTQADFAQSYWVILEKK